MPWPRHLQTYSEDAMIGEHGSGMIHLAQRPKRGAMMTDPSCELSNRP
jgi:hypothetical protein